MQWWEQSSSSIFLTACHSFLGNLSSPMSLEVFLTVCAHRLSWLPPDGWHHSLLIIFHHQGDTSSLVNLWCLTGKFLFLVWLVLGHGWTVPMNFNQLEGLSPAHTILIHLTVLPRGLEFLCVFVCVVLCIACTVQWIFFTPLSLNLKKFISTSLCVSLFLLTLPVICDPLWSSFLFFN